MEPEVASEEVLAHCHSNSFGQLGAAVVHVMASMIGLGEGVGSPSNLSIHQTPQSKRQQKAKTSFSMSF